MHRRLFLSILPPVLAALFGTVLSAQEQDLTLPKDLPNLTSPVILTVSGLDPQRFDGGVLELDLGRMAALGVSEFETSTIWTEGTHRYGGLMLADLLRGLGLAGQEISLEFRALNDYVVELFASEINDEAPLLAYLTDGKPMSVREKGPIWMIYPFDSNVDYRTDTTYGRSIWQLDRIAVLR